MRRTADAGRSHGNLAGMGFGIGDELGKRLVRQRRMHDQNAGAARHGRDRREIADVVVVELS